VNLLGEGALGLLLEAEGETVFTDVAVAAQTLGTRAVAEVERDGDAVPLGDVFDPVADGDDTTGGFVAEDLTVGDRVADPLAVTLPRVPVAPADAAGVDVDDDAVRRGLGRRDVGDLQRFAVFPEDCSSHTRRHAVTG
jgi:hypothetical protein